MVVTSTANRDDYDLKNWTVMLPLIFCLFTTTMPYCDVCECQTRVFVWLSVGTLYNCLHFFKFYRILADICTEFDVNKQ